MMGVIRTNLELCSGCNRCIRECPMEAVNRTYQDDEKIKVTIDNEKCITCGHCLSACKHNARHYEDDTERFFSDLANGVSISMIVTPSIRTNIPDYKRLFTYLKQLGVKKIYDVSLGADICIWAHVRYIEQRESVPPLITPSCPPIVNYCERYRQDLLKNLSPVHSPTACIAIYMKRYEGITDRIAALSPCIAKTDEFKATGLTEYNITFATLKKYIEKNKIKFPRKQTGFDHDKSGLGTLFSMPGGFKENIKFFTDDAVSVDQTEGKHVYDTLNIYAESTKEELPQIFDVLNCNAGCNMGTACSYSKSRFQVNREMDAWRKTVKSGHARKSFEELHKNYDNTFNLLHFLREYKPVHTQFHQITETDIEKAFSLLDKTDSDMQTIDCGACGSNTCRSMARKIALGVNIPMNCMVKAINASKKVHVESENQKYMLELGERMRAILDATPLCVHIWNEDLEVVDCNQGALDLFGLKSKEEYIERYFDFSPDFQPDGSRSSDKLKTVIQKVLETECQQRDEWMCRTADGEPLPIEGTLVPLNSKGKRFIAAYLRDLREDRRMLRQLDSTTEKLESALEEAKAAVHAYEAAQSTTAAMLESNPHINVLFNSKFQAVECNPAAATFMGFESKEATLAEFLNHLVHNIPPFQSDGKPSVSVGEQLVVASKQGSAKFETEIILDGKTRTLGVEFIRIPYEKSFGVVAYVVDMTAIHQREKELAHSRELNELQLAKLDLVVKATKIGLWDMEVVQNDPMNPNNVFTWSNECRYMLGYFSEFDFPDILGSLIDNLHPDDKEIALGNLSKHLFDTTGQTPYDVECRVRKKNGEYAYYRASGETIRDETGKALRIAGSMIDITETKNILLDTERQRLKAEAANQAKSAFLSTMSHEIRSPMNAILGITEILLQYDMLNPSVRDGLERIYVSGDMLLGIINDILDLSKIEAEKLELYTANYETASLINDVIQINIALINDKQIEFELHVDENLPMFLHGDELRVKQILNNLLSNAFKYTEKGSVVVSVYAEPGKTDDTVMLLVSVRDTGYGMTDAQIGKLFDKYARFNEETNRTTEGTGLGMNIAYNLIRMMDGTIDVESKPSEGSTFVVHLPQRRVNADILGKELAENLCKFRSRRRIQMKRVQILRDPMPYGSVLIVDDVETNIFVTKGLLAPYGIKVDATDSGFGAIRNIENGKVYDVIFMDHMMPKMDGVETTKKLRKMGYTRPIVALTANAISGQSEVFRANGFDDFISKPIDVRQLNAVLNKLVRDKHPAKIVKAAQRTRQEYLKNTPVFTIDQEFAEVFVRDAKKTISTLDSLLEKADTFGDEEIRLYIIYMHGIKNALANIGKMDLSDLALKLEMAGYERKLDIIAEESFPFIEMLRVLVQELTPAEKTGDRVHEDAPYLTEKLLAIKSACEKYDEKTADKELTKLRKKAWSRQAEELLSKIAEQLLCSEFEEIVDTITHFTETSLANDKPLSSGTLFQNKEIAGMDIARGIERYNGCEETYLKILRSYAASVRSVFSFIETVNENELADYMIKVHGIKGMSYDIFAEQVGKSAENLEKAADTGDFSYIREHNPAFLGAVQKLVSNIEDVISAINTANPKPKKDYPDNQLLLKLLAACNEYSMDGVNAVMTEIEKYQYESDDGLVEWLQEQVDMTKFSKIVEKLSKLT